MKHGFYFCLSLFIALQTVQAQTGAETAFSKSYAFEYDLDYSKAISSLLNLKTENYQIDLRLGWLYYLSKDYQKSEIFYRKAIVLEPGSIEARFGLALPLSALGNYNHVLDVYLEVLNLDPANSIANYRTASIYYNRHELVKAQTHINKVIRLYPFDYDSNLLAGKILQAQGKSAEARKALDKALQYNPTSEEAKSALKSLK
jgi:tetratricopeptide (TPR) repeat protein